MLQPPPLPQQIEGETSKAYNAFCLYLSLGRRRSIDKAWDAYTKEMLPPEDSSNDPPKKGTKRAQKGHKRAPSYFREWSSRWSWVDRSRAYDRELLSRRLEESEFYWQQVLVESWELLLELLEDQKEARPRLDPDQRTRMINALRELIKLLDFNDPLALEKLVALLTGGQGRDAEHLDTRSKGVVHDTRPREGLV
jgi:hypothetical protein